MRRFPPGFRDPEVERAYQHWQAHQIRPLIRFGTATATLMWALAWWVVRHVAPESNINHRLLKAKDLTAAAAGA